ncbi:Uma2 family endonuclease [Trichocoleus sp. FACHB-591]|uniref:Uma2 family endonuclease n=1 Tax=Trichocoleus sp. FACHB-591 TaxID=2692872 RepID=UPI00351BF13C
METGIQAIAMVQALPSLLSFEEFLDWCPEPGRYELIDGVVIELNPTGTHEKLAGFVVAELNFEIRQQRLPCFIPRTCTVRPFTDRAGYLPDVVVLDEQAVKDDPLWEKRSTITIGRSARLVVEVASTNWRDDYGRKLTDYEEMGIPEYWIIDYLALGASRYIGSPKQPTISVCCLVDGEYQVTRFTGSDRIVSQAFPGLQITANQVIEAAR